MKKVQGMTYQGLDKNNVVHIGDLYKKDGKFFIITKETDDRGLKVSYEVDPWSIKCIEL